ncbi:helix-turn-helix domain-containing protein [Pseudomonas entomophila]|uniref:helix-turn-helix domain-containing protein n=1 Tax=Pseudomonas entomophila TaxID=312306 RepID=UPI001F011073|nr:AraC family transcriptional regulator [Pseudomonas entomophila]MCG8291439.1 AraC family transcriptional regulator [Pseudomonas entomophila]
MKLLNAAARESESLEVRQITVHGSGFMTGGEERIYVVVEGTLLVSEAGVEQCLNPGELLFVRRGTYVKSASIGVDASLLWVPLSTRFLQHFTLRYGAMLSEIERFNGEMGEVMVFPGNSLTAECVRGLRWLMEFEHPPTLALLRVEELMMVLLSSEQGPQLMAMLRQQANDQVLRLQAFMEANFLKEWRLEELVRELGMSLTAFKDLFQNVYGVSPRAWISERRLMHAHQLLLNSERSIIDIAIESGFSSQSYFSQSYRRHFGRTPSHARTALQG